MKINMLKGMLEIIADEGKVLTTLSPSALRVKLLYTSEENKDYYIEVDEFPEIEIPEDLDIEEPEEVLNGLTLTEAYYQLLNENRLLKEENKKQDELIDITLMATDQMYCLLEPLLASMYVEDEAVNPLVSMYAAMVQRGLKTISHIPER